MEVTIVIGVSLFLFYAGYFLLLFIKSKKEKRPDKSQETTFLPLVSVVVATYNEEDTIVRKLTNLMEQDYPSMELIVIDSASNDRTVELVRQFIKDHKTQVRIVREKQRKGKASALNLVCSKYCSGEITAITDADAIWKKDALRKLVSSFNDSRIGAVTGRQVLLNADQESSAKLEQAYRHVFDVLRVGETVLDSTPIFNGPLMAFRSSLLEPIPEDTIADDSHLAVEIRRKGFRSVYNSDAIFYEYVPPTLRSRFVQKVRRGQGLVQLFLRQRRVLFNRKYGKYGTIIFPAEFFMHVVSPALLAVFLVSLFCSLFLTLSTFPTYPLIIAVLSVAITIIALATMRIGVTSFILTFLDSQFILLIALGYQLTGRSQHRWKKIPEVGKLVREARAKSPP